MADRGQRARATAPSLDELASALAFTIAQSVTVLKGAADLLDGRWDELGEQGRIELAHMMRRHADHLATLVEDFRDHPDVAVADVPPTPATPGTAATPAP